MDTIAARIFSQQQYQGDEAPEVIFELTNQSDKTVYVLTWDTPLEGLMSDCLEVKKNNEPVQYDGLFFKRAQPSADDFVAIEPGKSLQKKIDVGEAYDISGNGRIEVAFKKENLVYSFSPPHQMEMLALKSTDSKKEAEILSRQADFQVSTARKPIGERMRSTLQKKNFKLAAGVPLLLPCFFNGGSPSQQGIVQLAHQEGYNLVAASLQSFANDKNYASWFGAHTNTRFNKVQSNLGVIKQGFEKTSFTYDLTKAYCKPGAYAATTKGGNTIWICSGFWNAPGTGTDSQAGTILHEHSHASASTDDVGGYGQANCLRIAATTPDDAIRNADNYEYYAGG